MRRHVRKKSRGGGLENAEAQHWEMRPPPCSSPGSAATFYFLPEWSPVRNLTLAWGLGDGKWHPEPLWSPPSRREELVS